MRNKINMSAKNCANAWHIITRILLMTTASTFIVSGGLKFICLLLMTHVAEWTMCSINSWQKVKVFFVRDQILWLHLHTVDWMYLCNVMWTSKWNTEKFTNLYILYTSKVKVYRLALLPAWVWLIIQDLHQLENIAERTVSTAEKCCQVKNCIVTKLTKHSSMY